MDILHGMFSALRAEKQKEHKKKKKKKKKNLTMLSTHRLCLACGLHLLHHSRARIASFSISGLVGLLPVLTTHNTRHGFLRADTPFIPGSRIRLHLNTLPPARATSPELAAADHDVVGPTGV